MLVRAIKSAAQGSSAHCRSLSSVLTKPNINEFTVKNDPIKQYLPGSNEVNELLAALQCTASTTEDVPIVVGGHEIREGKPEYQVMPHDHQRAVAKFYNASEKTIRRAIDAATAAQARWDRTPLEERVRIFLCASELVATKYRQSLNAATMLGQSKTVIQAEIDSACELADFLRFNAYFLKEAAKYRPISENPSVTLNSMRFRGIDGFWAAIAPFNFTAIGGNLAATPVLMGNSVLWKPSSTAVLSNWRVFNILREAGIPDGVINFLPADGPTFGKAVTTSPHLAGINFTGSVPTFNWLWNAVGQNLSKYYNYPRLVGEVGGKNFHFVHPSADVKTVVGCTIRAAFEFCGQKCSACSRLYIPKSLYGPIMEGLKAERDKLKVGDVTDFSTFYGAVIDGVAFARITKYIEKAKKTKGNTIIAGGEYEDCKGYFIEPTIIEVCDPADPLLREELFGPVLAVSVYDDGALDATLAGVGPATPFALTGAVFAQDQAFLASAVEKLRWACGNLYINDKSTGAVVNQQPFGGGRMSGTNDKAGGPYYIMRFSSPQSVKETFVPQPDVDYPYMRQC